MINKSFETRYKKLNTEQKLAVDTTEGPVMVIAGPGSGKTELLSLRVANILIKTNASPQNILCLTYTENGALNMRERLVQIIGDDAYRVGIFTFHAFCNHIIARYPEYFYESTTFSPATDIVRSEILESLFEALPHKHVFASRHPEKGFAYLKDVRERIKHIKSGGYTPEEYLNAVIAIQKDYELINKILADWPEGRLGMKKLGEFEPFVKDFEKLNSATSALLSRSLHEAIIKTKELGKTTPLSDWKKKYTETIETTLRKSSGQEKGEELVVKDFANQEKIMATAEMYRDYTNEMHTRGFYDYDDMIIEVGRAIKNNLTLRNELEETYQYILIDEFQDTNEAQMNIVRAITSHEVHEGRPNVCVVGDDDQAIYKFQGAEVSHLINFRDQVYKDVQTIVLDKNYRSTQAVVDFGRKIIIQGDIRLENKYKDIQKILKAENTELPVGNIRTALYESDVEEYTVIADEIKDLLDKGTKPEEIAVLTRGHRELRAFLPYLDAKNIPYNYTKKANVFDEPHIKEIITVCEYISSILQNGKSKDYLLPTILSYKFFDIDRVELFQLALFAKKNNLSWLEAVTQTKDKKIKEAHDLLIKLAGDTPSSPVEHILETFMKESGFKNFYFNQEILKTNEIKYISFLTSLRIFLDALREWKEGETLTINDVAPFVEMHRDHDIALTSDSIITKSTSAISLMTAHASKGLEFEHVYIISAHDALWTKHKMTNKASLPLVFVPLLTPAGDNEDDFIRLLYVAMTRAKHSLSITGHEALIRYLTKDNNSIELEEDGEKEKPLSASLETSKKKSASYLAHEQALSFAEEIFGGPYKNEEHAVLKELLKDYKMPVTHLHNFVNIEKGGPLYFLEQNLLRFPQPLNPAGAYGEAIHKSIEEMIMYPKVNAGEKPTLKHILAKFDYILARARLPKVEHKFMSDRGHKTLTHYYKNKSNEFSLEDLIEVDMKNEGVVIDGAHLTGKIDFLRTKDGGYFVSDWKTGKSYNTWEGDDALSKIKLHNYKQQLIVYYLLLSNSHTYKLKVGGLALEFVEENDRGELITLNLEINNEEVERVKKLLAAVYKKIINTEFPDISNYSPDYKGIVAFEDDLIAGKI